MSGAAAVRTAYRLNVNKTKFYRFAKQYYPEIGPMKAAMFIKYPRSRDYALDFKVGEYYHHLFLPVCGGKARLGDEWLTYDNEGERVSRWECHSLTLDELRAFDMARRSEHERGAENTRLYLRRERLARGSHNAYRKRRAVRRRGLLPDNVRRRDKRGISRARGFLV